MNKSHFMSHNISLPVAIAPVYVRSAGLRPVSRREYLANPSSPTLRYEFDASTGDRHGQWDLWELRNEFLRPDEAWEGFFAMAGPWYPGYITHADFSEWQQLIREALVRPSKEWKTLAGKFDQKKVARLTGPLRIVFKWDGDVPVATVIPLNSLEGIIATVQIDALQGAQFRVCARHDCKNPPFRLEARHKIYCSPECAHLVAVRKSRERLADHKKGEGRRAPKSK